LVSISTNTICENLLPQEILAKIRIILKGVMNAIIEGFLVWWLRYGRYGWSKLRRFLFERRYLKKELPDVESVEEIQSCLKKITWTMDGPLHLFDSISYPQATWVKKKDDCDGFAALAAELLNQLGDNFNPVLVTAILRPVRASHTVCAFTSPDGNISFFDNGSVRNNCITYYQIIEKISLNSKKLVCWDIRTHDSLDLIEFHKT